MQVSRDARFIRRGGVELAYETFGDRGHPPLVLIAGLGADMAVWSPELCDALAGHDLQVVRFDNRDVGLSTRLHEPGYTLGDMADDAGAVIAALGPGAAHVVGQSVGGMIAQELALRDPDRVRSLCLLSTTPSLTYFTEAESAVESSPPAGKIRQLHALLSAGDLMPRLRSIVAPTVVIHGEHDRLISPHAAAALAGAIPGAELHVLRAVGHELTASDWPAVVDLVVANSRRAAARR